MGWDRARVFPSVLCHRLKNSSRVNVRGLPALADGVGTAGDCGPSVGSGWRKCLPVVSLNQLILMGCQRCGTMPWSGTGILPSVYWQTIRVRLLRSFARQCSAGQGNPQAGVGGHLGTCIDSAICSLARPKQGCDSTKTRSVLSSPPISTAFFTNSSRSLCATWLSTWLFSRKHKKTSCVSGKSRDGP